MKAIAGISVEAQIVLDVAVGDIFAGIRRCHHCWQRGTGRRIHLPLVLGLLAVLRPETEAKG